MNIGGSICKQLFTSMLPICRRTGIRALANSINLAGKTQSRIGCREYGANGFQDKLTL